MAVQAQCPLPGAFECFMTGFAGFLELGMSFNDIAGHDQRLDLGIGAWCYEG
jgi:hypothetical protein